MHPLSKKLVWRDTVFDSVLEANWAASLTVWGVDWEFHPGSLQLSDGRWYEPDFLLHRAGTDGEDVLLEVKGDHNDRIDKIYQLKEDHSDLSIMVGREPYLRGDDLGEYPGAVWEPSDYEWHLNGEGASYVSAEQATEEMPGLRFYRAIEGTRRIR